MTVENLVKPLGIGTKHPTLAYFYKVLKKCYSMTLMILENKIIFFICRKYLVPHFT